MRDYQKELENRVQYIKNLVEQSGVNGIIYGNSGGKDSALVGILCKKACDNTVGVMMPCNSKQNFTLDMDDGRAVADQFNIETRVIDLTEQRALAVQNLSAITTLAESAAGNIAPRLRMLTLYAVGGSESRLVAGTGNRSERHMGYFTKWGDGACDFNPISDLTATEVFEFLRFLDAPTSIIEKAPSAGLFEGQTDEDDMGVTYKAIDDYIETGKGTAEDISIIERYHRQSRHKREGVSFFAE